ncbi:calcium-binding protein [Thalassorhabdomicrobium marinisediminis]|uniref:calcium-binding protein n=1 Tax=Thalassorhabdomicrobium marinisediminis TaxID=2170577 RepID=UPI002492E470|nr:calcium-binding protein [Thalassorhabdomicrobium marinisediminis]
MPRVVNINSHTQSFFGTADDEHVILNAIASNYPPTATATIDGGAGVDILDLRNVYTNYSISDSRTPEGYFAVGTFYVTGFEEIIGHEYRPNRFLLQHIENAVTLYGGSGDDWFVTTFEHADTMYGYGGNDRLHVSSGDTAYGGSGDDVVELIGIYDANGAFADGGSGIDTLDLGFSWTVDLEAGTATRRFAGTYEIASFENVIVHAWSGYSNTVYGNADDNRFEIDDQFNDGSAGVYFDGRGGNDVLLGSRGNDTLFGGADEDRLSAGLGDDFLAGGSHSDWLDGGAGNDTIDGGTGYDTVDYSRASGGVTVHLEDGFATGAAGSDTLSRLEHVLGSAFNDTIYGTERHGNRLEGSTGSDIIFGLGGRDLLFGGQGDDMLHGGADHDRLFGGANEDRLEGGVGRDFLFGGSHDDRLHGGYGDDFIDGGTGYDTVIYSRQAGAVTVNLENGTATGAGGNDTLSRVEHVVGSAHDDTIYGTKKHGNRLDGSSGDDLIFGLAGRDVLLGSAGNDTLFGGADGDRLYGGSGDDVLVGGAAADLLYGGSGADRFVFNDISESGAGRYARDRIADFEAKEGDRVDVSLIDANTLEDGNQAFSFAEEGFTGSAGELILNTYDRSYGPITVASMDVDGDGVADGQIYFIGSVSIDDFIL